jgi:methyltransferase (TIGR00027 family)
MAPGHGSDRTAAGVAKLRHIETILPLDAGQKPLFEDPYAHKFYPMSWLVGCLINKIKKMLSKGIDGGLTALLVGRTRWIDDAWRSAADDGVKQIVILGAGYDMRAYRLALSADVRVFEVDHPAVQAKKKRLLRGIKNLPFPNVCHVPVDFQASSVAVELPKAEGYDASKPTLFTMEGVTQYIPKDASASSLRDAAKLCGPSSRVCVSYIPQDVLTAPEKVSPTGNGDEIRKRLLEPVAKAGEPWISAFGEAEFASFASDCGWRVASEVSIAELSKSVFAPAGRSVPEEIQYPVERYALLERTDGFILTNESPS